MTHSYDAPSKKIITFQSPEERQKAEFRDYQLMILDEVRTMIENGETRGVAIAVERSDFGIYTDFTGGFNPVLIGAVSQLLFRMNAVE